MASSSTSWVTDQTTGLEAICYSCLKCGHEHLKTIQKVQFCTQCHLAPYCSKECQKADWPKHKKDCARMLEICRMGETWFTNSAFDLTDPKHLLSSLAAVTLLPRIDKILQNNLPHPSATRIHELNTTPLTPSTPTTDDIIFISQAKKEAQDLIRQRLELAQKGQEKPKTEEKKDTKPEEPSPST